MRKKWLDRLFGGLVLIAVGVIFLLTQLNVIDVSIGYLLSTYWPVILIALGVKELFSGKKSFIGAFILLAVGFYFLGRSLGWDWVSPGGLFKLIIPALLILAGLQVLFRPHKKESKPHTPKASIDIDYTPEPPKPEDIAESTLDQQFEEKFGISYGNKDNNQDPQRPRKVRDPWDDPSFDDMMEEDDDDFDNDEDIKDHYKKRYKNYKHHVKQQMRHARHHARHERMRWEHEDYHVKDAGGKINRSAFIGDVHLGREHFQLKPTNISMFIGDTVLDLTNAHIPYGETKINLSACIGDIKVYIPDDADLGISVNGSSFIGDMSILNELRSGFMSSMTTKTDYYKDARKKIRINVSAFIGDIKVNKVG